jgi:hypothetical protein
MLTKVTAIQVHSCSTSNGRAVFVHYVELGEVSNITPNSTIATNNNKLQKNSHIWQYAHSRKVLMLKYAMFNMA